MPINHSIWRIQDKIEPIKESTFPEKKLEDILQKNIEILNEKWLVIGRQVKTKFNKYIDLLAIDINGSLIIIELKKQKTPREVVAQGLDYASWIKNLKSEEVSEIFEFFDRKYLNKGISLDEAFQSRFRTTLEEENLNSSHQIVIVATEMDSSTERIVNHLNDYDLPINVVFFKTFKENDLKYISRAWLIDPYETSDIASSIQRIKEPWNGEFYLSFGHSEERDWHDAKEFSFVSAGGGAWYSKTLSQLNPGDRIWVNIPGEGYVGVGKVTETAKKADEVIFNKKGNIYNLSKRANYFSEYINDEDRAEYIVKVKWIKTFDIGEAVSELGFFGNQNTVCKPRTSKWPHTVDRLKQVWNVK